MSVKPCTRQRQDTMRKQQVNLQDFINSAAQTKYSQCLHYNSSYTAFPSQICFSALVIRIVLLVDDSVALKLAETIYSLTERARTKFLIDCHCSPAFGHIIIVTFSWQFSEVLSICKLLQLWKDSTTLIHQPSSITGSIDDSGQMQIRHMTNDEVIRLAGMEDQQRQD